MVIEEIIYRHSITSPEKTAVISGEVTVSYRVLWNNIKHTAAYFISKGVGKGDRIIVSASKNIDFIYAYFGAHLAGCICVPIDPETNVTRLERIIDCAAPSMIIGELRNKGGHEVLPFTEIGFDKDFDVVFPQERDIADLLFTTGTTGMPKGVVLSYSNQLSAANNINTFIGNTSEDIELLALPISHSFGLGRLRCVLAKGATLVLLGSFASMKRFFGEIERCRVTGFGMVPASWAYIAKMSADRIARYASQLRYIEIGSAFMAKTEKERLMRLLPDTKICMHYGLTEASRSAFIDFHTDMEHLDSVGKSSPGTEIVVCDEQGNLLAAGQEGELCVKGGHVCAGYWGVSEDIFRNDFYNGYFKTGDWGYIDHSGYIYLKSRKKEIINVGGKKVSPIEVEEALNSIPGIEESACIGVHDDVMGEVVKAFIVGCLTEEDDERVRKEMAALVENYKIPVYLEHIDSIPRTTSGKIQRLLLK